MLPWGFHSGFETICCIRVRETQLEYDQEWTMKLDRIAALFVSLFVLNANAVRASVLDISYTVSGSPGDWTYDFTVTNNIALANVYAVAFDLPGATYVSAPAGWVPATANFSPYGQWCLVNCDNSVSGIATGSTLGGFLAHETDANAQTSVLSSRMVITPVRNRSRIHV
jgi:hypothetical protein